MKKIVIILAISIAVLFAGCVSEEGSYKETEKMSEISKKSTSPLDIVPKSSEKVVYTKTEGFVNLLGEDSKIVNAYKKLIGKYGLSVDDIEYTIQADNTYILKGYGLDEYKFMDEFGLDYEEKKYHGANMLINEDYDYAVAKYKNYLIHGNIDDVKRVIDTIKGDYPPITDKKEIKEILSKVDDGYAIANIGENYKGNVGVFIYPKGKNVKFVVVTVCNDVDDAKKIYESTKEELENELNEGNIKDYDIDRDGNIVVAEVIMSKEEFLGDYANKLGLNFEDEIKDTNEYEDNTQTEKETNHANTYNNQVEQKIKTTEFTKYHDDFNNFNKDFWMAKEWVTLNDAYDKIKVEDGILDMPVEETDRCGFVVSKSIPVEKGDIIKIKRKVKMHYANEYFTAGLKLLETNNEGFRLGEKGDNWMKPLGDDLFNVKYLHYYYKKLGYPITDGILVYSKNWKEPNYYMTFDLPFDKWFEEEITYNTATGELTYSINGKSKTIMAKPLSKDYVRIMMHPYGWWTGHDVKVDYIDIKIIKGGKQGQSEEQTSNEQESGKQIEKEQETEQKEQEFKNNNIGTESYELPLKWKEVEVAGMDGVMFDFGNKKVTFEDIGYYSHYAFKFNNPIIIDGNKIWFINMPFKYNDNYGFDAQVNDVELAKMPYNVKAICYDLNGAGWFIEDDKRKLHYVIFDYPPKEAIMDKTGNVKIKLYNIKKDTVVANVDVDELISGVRDNRNNYKIVIGWKGNKLYLISMKKNKFENWAYNSWDKDDYNEPFPPVQIKEFEFDGNVIDARSGPYDKYIIVATDNGLYVITVNKREPDEFKITDSLKANIECYAFDTNSGSLVYYDGNKVYYTDINVKFESDDSDIYYIARNYEGGLDIDGVTGLSITNNYNWLGTQVKVAGDGWIKTYNIEFEAKKDAEGNYVSDKEGNSIYIVKFEPKNVYYDEIYDKYYDIKVPFAGKYIYRSDNGDSKNGRVEFRVYTTDNKLYMFGTKW